MTETPLTEGEDFYLEGPYVVFTAKYLLKRGYCCKSGCRHCPYGFTREEREQQRDQSPSPEIIGE